MQQPLNPAGSFDAGTWAWAVGCSRDNFDSYDFGPNKFDVPTMQLGFDRIDAAYEKSQENQ